ncbi:MAG: hypothetical protein V1873_08500 [Verrucomicrobiota bacterium]
MRSLTVVVTALVALSAVMCTTPANAWWRSRRAAHADQNKDGVVTHREAHKERAWEHEKLSDVNKPWERRADKDGDGHVEPGEYHAYRLQTMDANHNGEISEVERKFYWNRWNTAVNTEIEKKYDDNGDGYLEWPEAKELLRARLAVISTDGRAIVTTSLEREFDTNGDGVIDGAEAEAVRKALE